MSFISPQQCTVITILILRTSNNHSSEVWHFQTVMRAEIKFILFILAYHHSLKAAATVKLFMINASMILLSSSLSCMIMMWFNVPVLFKIFLFEIHPEWPYFFHPVFTILVKLVKFANPENSWNIYSFNFFDLCANIISHNMQIYLFSKQ